MPIDERSLANRRRAESFGALADAYDRVRPGYPPALIDDLVAERPGTALDVGCGTGRAARLLIARGVAVLGVEIDQRMADVARAHGLPVETAKFETWDPAGRRFDLVVCGQAWHWIDPVVGQAKAAELLRPRGVLALFWNFAHFEAATQRALDAAYDAVAPQLGKNSVVRGGGPATMPDHIAQLRRDERLVQVEHRRYPWQRDYQREEWLDLVRTHSDHSTLPAGQLSRLLAALRSAIDSVGGVVHARYVTEAVSHAWAVAG